MNILRNVRKPWWNFLYVFDANNHSAGPIPSELDIDDDAGNYDIAVDWTIGKYLRKTNTTFKTLWFNSYNAFEVQPKARFYFYVTSVTDFSFVFTTSAIKTWWTWGFAIGYEDNGANAETKAYRMNNRDNFLLTTSVVNSQVVTLTPWTLYVAEVWNDLDGNDESIRLSTDGGQTYGPVSKANGSTNNKRIACALGNGKQQKCMLVRVEVEELV